MKPHPATLRALLEHHDLATAPGGHDALSARIIERAGHPCVYLGGNAMALGLGKGQPFITLTETAEIAARVARAVSIPVLVDAGAGFGGLAHLDLAIRELEMAGAAGLHLDDQPYPKSPDYHRGRGELAPVETMAARIKTACAARRDADFLIVARTDALRVTGSFDEAVARARACAAAGADGLIVLDLGPDQARAMMSAVPGLPLLWIGGVHAPVPDVAQLQAAGFSAALYPFNGIAEIATRLFELWGGLHDGGLVKQDDSRLARARQDTLALADMPRLWNIGDKVHTQ